MANVLGAVGGGILAAQSVADMPSSVATFVAFTVFLDIMAPGQSSPTADERLPGKPDDAAASRERARKAYAERHAASPTRLRALDKK